MKFKAVNSWVIERNYEPLYYNNDDEDDCLIIFDCPSAAAAFLEDMLTADPSIDMADMRISYYREIECRDYIDCSTKTIWCEKDVPDSWLIFDRED